MLGPQTANRFLAFVNASPTPFHAVANAAVLLENAGFRKVSSWHLMGPHLPRLIQIREKDEWENNLSPGGKYYFTRYPRPLVSLYYFLTIV
jgi:aspartyl aminopeptidase